MKHNPYLFVALTVLTYNRAKGKRSILLLFRWTCNLLIIECLRVVQQYSVFCLILYYHYTHVIYEYLHHG